MDKVIPVFYAEYGRYISRFRMIPLDSDALLPVDRRLLLSMHEMARKTTKSARIVGYTMGQYHAHGDSSIYGALVGLVREGFADDSKSTWGGPGLIDFPAPASRYCITGDTLISSTNKGVFPIKDLFSQYNIDEKTKPFKINLDNLNVISINNKSEKASHAWYSGYRNIVEIKTKNGTSIKCTPNQPFRIPTKTGYIWKTAENLTTNDFLCQTNYNSNYIFSKIESITPIGKDYVFDLTVPSTHGFTANGYLIHNTESSISPWVEDFAFEYINYVPWELLELSSEPLYLPCIIPLGLIGDGIISGIAYHKTVIPKYKKEDLAKRLLWLIENGKPETPKSFDTKLNSNKYGPLIKPCKEDCDLVEAETNAFYKLLLFGEGKIEYQPKVSIGNKEINILGRVPNTSFQPLLNAFQKGKLPFSEKPIDQSKKNNININCKLKRGTNENKTAQEISKDYLNKTINFKCYFCRLDGEVNQYPIDNVLLNCFNLWKNASLKKFIDLINKINDKLVDNTIFSEIRKILKTNNNINSIDDIIKHFPANLTFNISSFKNNTWSTLQYVITNDRIKDTCRNSPIQKLIEYKSIETELKTEFNKIKKIIDNHDKYTLERIKHII